MDDQLQAVLREARAIYGADLPERLEGVLHVVSAWRAEAARLHVLAINEHAPKSASDFFVLNFWRAHCDAILTTAQVVRAEPKLSHELQGPLSEGLVRYRTHILQKPQLAWCAVLTRSGALSAEHAMFADKLKYVVLTGPEAAPRLARALGARAEVVARDPLDLRSAIAFARARGARSILIEAGPSTAGQLYAPPAGVDHLMLSVCGASQVDAAAVGGALPPDEQLLHGLELRSEVSRDEQSGPWRFLRYARAAHSR